MVQSHLSIISGASSPLHAAGHCHHILPQALCDVAHPMEAGIDVVVMSIKDETAAEAAKTYQIPRPSLLGSASSARTSEASWGKQQRPSSNRHPYNQLNNSSSSSSNVTLSTGLSSISSHHRQQLNSSKSSARSNETLSTPLSVSSLSSHYQLNGSRNSGRSNETLLTRQLNSSRSSGQSNETLSTRKLDSSTSSSDNTSINNPYNQLNNSSSTIANNPKLTPKTPQSFKNLSGSKSSTKSNETLSTPLSSSSSPSDKTSSTRASSTSSTSSSSSSSSSSQNSTTSARSGTLLLTSENLRQLAALHPPQIQQKKEKQFDAVSQCSSTHFTVVNGLGGRGQPATRQKSCCARNQLTVLVCTMTLLFSLGLLAAVVYMEMRARARDFN